MVTENLKPAEVFEIFEEISRIPHGSYNIDAISDWIVAYAQTQGFQCIQDRDKNVIVIKAADEGYEDVPALIVQGHMDMVCSKEPGIEHDFTKDSLKLYVEDGFLKAKGTTLGADDGIAIAFALAAMSDSSIKTGRIEAVFTVNEEVGLLGAQSLDTSRLTGKYMINIDSAEEGHITVGCAGGLTANIKFPTEKEETKHPAYRLDISGLNGGHSGEQIDQGLANANMLLKDLLLNLNEEVDLQVSSISGGIADNAIPAHAEAVIYLSDQELEKAKKLVAMMSDLIRIRYAGIDDHIHITLLPYETKDHSFISKSSFANILNFMTDVPNGVMKMSRDIEGLVETSLNLGVIDTGEDDVTFIISIRSSVEEEKQALYERVAVIAANYKGKSEKTSEYPGWQFNQNSKLRPLFCKIYSEMYGKAMKVEAIHAGLECGIFSGKIKGLDSVSMGPDVFDLHTTTERLSIESAKRTYAFFTEILKSFSKEIKS